MSSILPGKFGFLFTPNNPSILTTHLNLILVLSSSAHLGKVDTVLKQGEGQVYHLLSLP